VDVSAGGVGVGATTGIGVNGVSAGVGTVAVGSSAGSHTGIGNGAVTGPSQSGLLGSEPGPDDVPSFAERAARLAARAAAEAARLAALAADTAQRIGERQAGGRSDLPFDLASQVADAAMDSARAAADAAREAERAAAEAARITNASLRDSDALARREAIRARDAAERAWEAAEEAGDRPAQRTYASSSTLPTGFFQNAWRGMRAEASFVRGRSLFEARKYQEARELLREATALYPDHDQARALLAWSEYFLGDLKGAIISFKSTLRRQPTWEGLYDGLGWSRFGLKRHHLAIAAFRPALDRNPNYVDALNGLGSALFELGQYDLALPPLEQALRGSRPLLSKEPTEAVVLRAKVAWSLYHLGRYREALATFIQASLAAPDSHQFQEGIGWCYIQLGQKEQARAAFQRALLLAPADKAVLEGLRRASR
jgi:tetratricopeptide (TPR) repeat protein